MQDIQDDGSGRCLACKDHKGSDQQKQCRGAIRHLMTFDALLIRTLVPHSCTFNDVSHEGQPELRVTAGFLLNFDAELEKRL